MYMYAAIAMSRTSIGHSSESSSMLMFNYASSSEGARKAMILQNMAIQTEGCGCGASVF